MVQFYDFLPVFPSPRFQTPKSKKLAANSLDAMRRLRVGNRSRHSAEDIDWPVQHLQIISLLLLA
jgi:hypothetical protein